MVNVKKTGRVRIPRRILRIEEAGSEAEGWGGKASASVVGSQDARRAVGAHVRGSPQMTEQPGLKTNVLAPQGLATPR